MKPYPNYKSSGVEWLGDVPEHWDVRRIRSIAEMRVSNVDKHTKEDEFPIRLCNYVDVYKNDHITKDMPLMSATASRSEIEKFRLVQGDVLITKDSESWDDIGVPALVVSSADDLVCGYHLALLRPSEELLGAYLAWALQSKAVAYQFHVRANGVTRYGLAHFGIESVRIPLPRIPEQNTIVRYLDYIDQRIQRYIAAKRKLIGLLEEERQAIVNRAVTRGLNPDVRLKPSGVEWLGDVPEHWEVWRLKHWVGINEAVLSETTDPAFQFQYLEIGAVGTGILVHEPTTTTFGNAPSRARRIVRMGDTIISTVRTYLKAVWFAENVQGNLICSTGFAVLTPRNSTSPKFVSYLTQSNAFTDRVTAESVGIAYPAIAENRFGTFHIPVPPKSEQTAIVNYLDKTTTNINATITHTRRQLDLMQEYRTRLIADVVTGKLDVREAAAQASGRHGEQDGGTG